MGRTYKREFTIKCDRCARENSFTDECMEGYDEWKQLNTVSGLFSFFGGKSFDLCPDCYKEFQTAFINWVPPAFKKAIDP